MAAWYCWGSPGAVQCVIYGDGFEFLYDKETGRLGLIDWGTVGWGPLLYDVALAGEMFDKVSKRQVEMFQASYLAESPVKPQEMEGVRHYPALNWALLAKFFAWRLAHNVTHGDDDPTLNERSLLEIREALERML
jgi:Ser/Thr protein kinase RdoA (MazF antagonist)